MDPALYDAAADWRETGEWGAHEADVRVLSPSGEARWVRVFHDVRRDAAGRARKAFGLVLDIDEKKKAELALVAAERAAQAANEAKAQFLANMSHEIRTPMNGVLGVMHVLRRELPAGDSADLLGEALAAGQMLSTLLDDVIDISRIEAGRLDLNREAVDPRDLVRGVARLLAGLVFCLGLILVVLGGAELFTGNTLMVMAWASGKVQLGEMLRAWAIVYVGNFVGAIGTAGLVFLSGQYLAGNGAVAAVALDIARTKAVEPFGHALFLGVLCNVLVCLAVWLSLGARATADKVLAIIFPVSAFVVAGFEHSVANMYLLPLGLFIRDGAPAGLWDQIAATPADFAALTWPAFLANLVPVTIGNIIGGGVLVGGVYWFIYLRPRRPDA